MESQSRRLLAYWAGFVLVTSFLGQETMATSGGVSLGPPQAGLVAHYPFNGNANDQSGGGYHGQVLGADLAADRFGAPGRAYYFDGDHFDLIAVNLPALQQITFTVWVKTLDVVSGGGAGRLLKVEPECFDIAVNNSTGNGEEIAVQAGLGWASTQVRSEKNQWNFFAFDCNGTVLRVHKNGILVATLPASASSISPRAFGAYTANRGDDLHGYLDDIRIYNRVLTTEEIGQIYHAEALPLPLISLIGSNPLEIYKGSPFNDPGALLLDDTDAPRILQGTGAVDTNTVGFYTLTYSGTDVSGNPALPVIRTVNVVLDPAADEDSDGVANGMELTYGTDPTKEDTDGDGLSDGYELGFGRYEVVPGHFTWEQARRDAETKGGHLLTVSHAQEWQMVQDRLGAAMPSENYWMGGTDSLGEGNWIWVTGERWTYTHWAVHSGFIGGGTITLGGGGTLTLASLAGEGFVNLGDGYLTIFPPTLILPPGGLIPISSNEPNGGSSENYLGGRLSPLGGIFWGSQSKAWGDFGDEVFSSYILERGAHTSATLPDTDGDGANDKAEVDAGTDPNDPDLYPALLIWPFAGLDVPNEPALWTSGGPAWTTRIGGLISHDGQDVAAAGTADGQISWIQRNITGPAYVEFWWRGSSETDYDFFSYSVNGAVQERFSGERGWARVTRFLPFGTHTIRWSYEKDENLASGEDAVFVDRLTIIPGVADLSVSQGGGPVSSTWTIDFDSVLEGSAFVDRTLTLSNQGNLGVTLIVSVPEGSGFQILNAPDWLEPNQSTDVTVRMLTSAAGAKDTFLTITAPGSATPPPLIRLTGEVLAKRAKLGLTKGGVTIPTVATVALGYLPAMAEFSLSNEGTDVLRPIVTVLGGELTVLVGPDSEISPGVTAPLVLLFNPTSHGWKEAQISLQTNDPDRPETLITFTGTAVLPNSGARGVSLGQMGGGSGWQAVSGGELAVNGGANNSQSYVEATYQGPGLLSWSWKTQIQEKNDFLSCTVNGTEIAGISKKNGLWENQMVALPDTICTVRWSYLKDPIGWTGTDRVWLANIQYRPFLQPRLTWQEWLGSQGNSAASLRTQANGNPVQIGSTTQIVAGMPALLAFLGGVDPVQGPASEEYRAIVTNSQIKYRYGINKTAGGDLMQRPMFSQDLGTWTSRGFAQQIVSEDDNRIVVEVSMPMEGLSKGFYRVDAIGTIPGP